MVCPYMLCSSMYLVYALYIHVYTLYILCIWMYVPVADISYYVVCCVYIHVYIQCCTYMSVRVCTRWNCLFSGISACSGTIYVELNGHPASDPVPPDQYEVDQYEVAKVHVYTQQWLVACALTSIFSSPPELSLLSNQNPPYPYLMDIIPLQRG